MPSSLITTLLISITSFLITYGIGQLLSAFIKIPDRFPFLKEFAKLTIGFYTVSTFYAILNTNGITIQLGLLPISVLTVYWLKKNKYLVSWSAYKKNLATSIKLQYLCIELSVLVLSILYLYFSLYGIYGNIVKTINGDFFCYASFIENINKMGVESSYLDWYSGIPPLRNLYHWGELWYAAFFIKIFSLKSINGFYFVLYPFCLVVYYTGAVAIIEIFTNNALKQKYFTAIFILFVAGLSFYFPTNTIFTRGDWWTNPMIYQPKYLVTGIYIIYLVILSQYKKTYLIILASMATLLGNMAAGAAILLFIGLYILHLFFIKAEKFKTVLQLTIPVFITLGFIALYALAIKYINSLHPVAEINFNFTTQPISIAYYLKTAFNCFAGQIIKSTLSLLPYLLCFYIFKKTNQIKINKELIITLVLLHISSILAYSILFGLMVDSIQLYTYIFVPMNAVCCFLIIQFIIRSNSKKWKLTALLFVALSIYQYYAWQPKTTINLKPYTAILKIYNNSNIAILKGEKDFNSLNEKNVNGYFPFPYLKFYLKNYNPVCLTTLDIPIDSNATINLIKTEKEIIQTSTFYRFTQKQKNENKFVSIEQSQLDLIKENNIHSVFVYKNAQLPELIRKSIVDSVYDKSSGITFYTF